MSDWTSHQERMQDAEAEDSQNQLSPAEVADVIEHTRNDLGLSPAEFVIGLKSERAAAQAAAERYRNELITAKAEIERNSGGSVSLDGTNPARCPMCNPFVSSAPPAVPEVAVQPEPEAVDYVAVAEPEVPDLMAALRASVQAAKDERRARLEQPVEPETGR